MRIRGERSVQELYEQMPAVPETEACGTREDTFFPFSFQASDEGPGANLESIGASDQNEEEKTYGGKKKISESSNCRSESGTCNVCSAPCSSCLHRSLKRLEPKVECESSIYSCVKAENDALSVSGTKRKLNHLGRDNDDQLSATSSHSSSEKLQNKASSKIRDVGNSYEGSMALKDSRTSMGDHSNPKKSTVGSQFSVSRLLKSDSNSRSLLEKNEDMHADSNGDNVSSVSASSRSCRLSLDKSCNELGRFVKKDAHNIENKLKNLSNTNEESPRSKADLVHNAHCEQDVPLESPNIRLKRLRMAHSFSDECKGAPLQKDGIVHESLQSKSALEISGKPCNLESAPSLHVQSLTNGNNFFNGHDAADSQMCHPTAPMKEVFANNTCVQEDIVHQNERDDQDRNHITPLKNGSSCNSEMHRVSNQPGVQEIEYGGLIDVNVCDICGDVGREDLLATCSRCMEGAEHTYCMRVKLDKVPQETWLCEDCQFLEISSEHKINGTDDKVNAQRIENEPVTVQKPNVTCREFRLNKRYQDLRSPSSYKKLQDNKPVSYQQKTYAKPKEDCSKRDGLNSESSLDCQKSEARLRTGSALKSAVRVTDVEGPQSKEIDATKRPACLQKACVTTKTNSLYGNNQTPKRDSKWNNLEIKVPTRDTRQVIGLQSPQKLGKRLTENVSFGANRNGPENIMPPDTANLKKQSVLSREDSFRKAGGQSRNSVAGALRTGVHGARSPETLHRSYSSGNLLKGRVQSSSPRASFNQQLAFKSTNAAPKVKQLTESVPPTRGKLVRHASLSNRRDEGSDRKFIKSSSFKCKGTVFGDTDIVKQRLVSSSRGEECQVKGINVAENICHVPMKAAVSGASKNQIATGASKHQITRGSSPVSKIATQDKESALKICNQRRTGDETSLCRNSCDDLNRRVIKATATSDVQSMRARGSGSNGGKSASEAAKFKHEYIKEGLLQKNSEELGTINGTTPKGKSASESVSLKQENEKEELLRKRCEEFPASDATAPKIELHDAPYGATSAEMSQNGESAERDLRGDSRFNCKTEETSEYDEKNSLQQYGWANKQSTEIANTFKCYVIPEHKLIWRGALEIRSAENNVEIFYGFQAHLSSCVSHKVHEVLRHFPLKLQMQELSRISTWPCQFQKTLPCEDNIALFFFAKDIESYTTSYKKLLDNMIANDLSLKGNIHGVDLLVFPSDRLPERYQRWNNLYFLWGVFCSKKSESSNDPPVAESSCINSASVTPYKLPFKAMPSLVIDLNENPVEYCADDPSREHLEEKLSSSIDQNPSPELLEEKLTSSIDQNPSPELLEEQLTSSIDQNSANDCGTLKDLEGSPKAVNQETPTLSATSLVSKQPDCGSYGSLDNCVATHCQVGAHESRLPPHALFQNSQSDLIESAATFPFLLNSISKHAKAQKDAISEYQNQAQGSIGPSSTDQISMPLGPCAFPGFANFLKDHSETKDHRKSSFMGFLPQNRYSSESLDGPGTSNSEAFCGTSDDQAKHKRRKLCDDAHDLRNYGNHEVGLFSCSILPSPTFRDVWSTVGFGQGIGVENAGNTKSAANGFSVDPGSIQKTRNAEVIEVLSSDDEGVPGPSTLILGVPISDMKPSVDISVLSLSIPGRSPVSVPASENGEVAGASLSLSLSLPGTEEWKAELDEDVRFRLKSCANTSLRQSSMGHSL